MRVLDHRADGAGVTPGGALKRSGIESKSAILTRKSLNLMQCLIAWAPPLAAGVPEHQR
jgi:hypothetical protein